MRAFDYRFRIAVMIFVFLFLGYAMWANRRLEPARAEMMTTVSTHLRESRDVRNIVGDVSDIRLIARYSESFYGKPAYRLVQELSGSKGEFVSYVTAVQERESWTVFALDIKNKSDGKMAEVIAYGKSKR